MKRNMKKAWLAPLLVFALTGTFVFAESPEPGPTPTAEQNAAAEEPDAGETNELLPDSETSAPDAETPVAGEQSEEAPAEEETPESEPKSEETQSLPAPVVYQVKGISKGISVYMSEEDAKAVHAAECGCDTLKKGDAESMITYTERTEKTHTYTELTLDVLACDNGHSYYIAGGTDTKTADHEFGINWVDSEELGRKVIGSLTPCACGYESVCTDGGAHSWVYGVKGAVQTTYERVDDEKHRVTEVSPVMVECSVCNLQLEDTQTEAQTEDKGTEKHTYGSDDLCEKCGSKNPAAVEITGISATDVFLEVAGSKSISVTLKPSGVQARISYSVISGGDCIKLDKSSGKVTGQKVGTAKVRVIAENAKSSVNTTVSVEVSAAYEEWTLGGNDDDTDDDTDTDTDTEETAAVTQSFGLYEQDGDETDGAEAIDWIVLSEGDGVKVMISRCGLDVSAYNKEVPEDGAPVTWENSTLREWLNGDFVDLVFTEKEQAKLREVTLTTPDNTDDEPLTTHDMVYLLSAEEASRYFETDSARVCKATDAVKAKTYVSDSGACWWWLRDWNDSCALVVSENGTVSEGGCDMAMSSVVIRPVIAVAVD